MMPSSLHFLRVIAKVKQEVWDALLKRYEYEDVTDMLALIRSASVIKRAVRAMRMRKWTRKFARIDPEMIEKVDRLRKIQVSYDDWTHALTRSKAACISIFCACLRVQLRRANSE